mmetsp:Transcript_18398/g.56919  ORF Transcript_18398/g.56919 Transcript_18398/m.56919 type:complete len:316 (+) Transcript_18398:1013-1960(+)
MAAALMQRPICGIECAAAVVEAQQGSVTGPPTGGGLHPAASTARRCPDRHACAAPALATARRNAGAARGAEQLNHLGGVGHPGLRRRARWGSRLEATRLLRPGGFLQARRQPGLDCGRRSASIGELGRTVGRKGPGHVTGQAWGQVLGEGVEGNQARSRRVDTPQQGLALLWAQHLQLLHQHEVHALGREETAHASTRALLGVDELQHLLPLNLEFLDKLAVEPEMPREVPLALDKLAETLCHLLRHTGVGVVSQPGRLGPPAQGGLREVHAGGLLWQDHAQETIITQFPMLVDIGCQQTCHILQWHEGKAVGLA